MLRQAPMRRNQPSFTALELSHDICVLVYLLPYELRFNGLNANYPNSCMQELQMVLHPKKPGSTKIL